MALNFFAISFTEQEQGSKYETLSGVENNY